MRIFFIFLTIITFGPATAKASPYLALSSGSSFENHNFNIWNGAGFAGRRYLEAKGKSKDYAIAFGYRNAFHIGSRPFDLELELFQRSNSSFSASGNFGLHPTKIKTTSSLISTWSPIANGADWQLLAGAGIGMRHSKYKMTGTGINITATDRAPYAMLGLRYSKTISPRIRFFSDFRIHTRPPIHSPSTRAFSGPLEHNSKGITLRIGAQIALGR